MLTIALALATAVGGLDTSYSDEHVVDGPNNTVCDVGGLTSVTYFRDFHNDDPPYTQSACKALYFPPADTAVRLTFNRRRYDVTGLDALTSEDTTALNLQAPTFSSCDYLTCDPGPCLVLDMDYLYDDLSTGTRTNTKYAALTEHSAIPMAGVPRCGPYFGVQMRNMMNGTILPSPLASSVPPLLPTPATVMFPAGSRTLPVAQPNINTNPLWYYQGNTPAEQKANRFLGGPMAHKVCNAKSKPYGVPSSNTKPDRGAWGYSPGGKATLFGGLFGHFDKHDAAELADSAPPSGVNYSAHPDMSFTNTSFLENARLSKETYPPYAYRVPQLIPANHTQSVADDTHYGLFNPVEVCDLSQCDFRPNVAEGDANAFLACMLVELVLFLQGGEFIANDTNYANTFAPSCFSGVSPQPEDLDMDELLTPLDPTTAMTGPVPPPSPPSPPLKARCRQTGCWYKDWGKRSCCFGTEETSKETCTSKWTCKPAPGHPQSASQMPSEPGPVNSGTKFDLNAYWSTACKDSKSLYEVQQAAMRGDVNSNPIMYELAQSPKYPGKTVPLLVPVQMSASSVADCGNAHAEMPKCPTDLPINAPEAQHPEYMPFLYKAGKHVATGKVTAMGDISGNGHREITGYYGRECANPMDCTIKDSGSVSHTEIPTSYSVHPKYNSAASYLQNPMRLDKAEWSCQYRQDDSSFIDMAISVSGYRSIQSSRLKACASGLVNVNTDAVPGLLRCLQTTPAGKPFTAYGSDGAGHLADSISDVMGRLASYAVQCATGSDLDSNITGFDAVVDMPALQPLFSAHQKWWEYVLEDMADTVSFGLVSVVAESSANAVHDKHQRKLSKKQAAALKTKIAASKYTPMDWAISMPDQWMPAPMTGEASFESADAFTAGAPCDCGGDLPVYKSLGVPWGDRDSTSPYATASFSAMERSDSAWFVELGYGWGANVDYETGELPIGLYIPSNPKYSPDLMVYERDVLTNPEDVGATLTDEYAPDTDKLRALLFTPQTATSTFQYKYGACMRLPYGRVPYMSMDTVSQQKYFPGYSAQGATLVTEEASYGYCELTPTHPNKPFFHCVNDGLSLDSRTSFCSSPRAKRIVVGAAIRSRSVEEICNLKNVDPAKGGADKTCLIIPGSLEYGDINSIAATRGIDLTNYTMLITPFDWTVAAGFLGKTRYWHEPGGGSKHGEFLTPLDITDNITTGMAGLDDDEFGMLLSNTLTVAEVQQHVDSIVGKINCAASCMLPWLDPLKPVTSAVVFPKLELAGQAITFAGMTVMSATSLRRLTFARPASLATSEVPCTQFLVSAPFFTLEHAEFDQSNCQMNMPPLNRAVVVFGGADNRDAVVDVDTVGAEMPLAFLGDYTSSFPKNALANVGVAHLTVSTDAKNKVEYIGGLARANGTVVLHPTNGTPPLLIQPYRTAVANWTTSPVVLPVNIAVLPAGYPVVNVSHYTAVFGDGVMQRVFAEEVVVIHHFAIPLFVVLLTANVGIGIYFIVYMLR